MRCGVAKRLMDIFCSLAGFVLFSPLMLWIAIRVRREMSPPALFTQTRAGKDGKPFKLYKYRTMTNETNARGELLSDEQRLTGLGKWLRSTSLDELPQLWNVLKGDMSIVGPRPLLPEYVSRYNERERRRLDVKPGITGWAQINGRNAISWQEKFALDSWYVDHRTFALDVRIIALTIKKTLRREGISAAGEATMPPFMGSEEAPEVTTQTEKMHDEK